MASTSIIDFSAIIGKNRHYQPARIASIRPRSALVYKKQSESSSSSKEEEEDAESDKASIGEDETYYYVVEDDDDEAYEDQQGRDFVWKDWLKSDLEIAAEEQQQILRTKQPKYVVSTATRSNEELIEEQIKIDCERHARNLIRNTNYIRFRNLEEEEEEEECDHSTENPTFSSDTFYSWLLENSYHAETLFCPRQPTLSLNGTTSTSLPPAFHEIEQSNWESKINWEGTSQQQHKCDASTTLSNRKPSATSDTAGVLLSRLYNPVLADDTIDFSKCINWEGTDAPPKVHEALKNSVPLILEDSVAGTSVARLSLLPRRPEPLSRSEIYLRRCQRESSSQGGANVNSSNLFYDFEKDETIIAQRQEKRAKMAIDKSKRVIEAMGTLDLGGGKGRAITSSLMGPGGTERTGRPTKGLTSSAYDAEYVVQLDMILNHQLVKPDWKKTELRHFHRPRLPQALVKKDRVWQLKLRKDNIGINTQSSNIGSNQGKLIHTSGRGLGSNQPHIKIKSESDLSASEGDLIIIEYCEERLPLQMAKGTASKIINYYRGDKSRCPISGMYFNTHNSSLLYHKSLLNLFLYSCILFLFFVAGGGDRPPKVKRSGGDSTQNNLLALKMEKPRFEAIDESFDAAKLLKDLVGTYRKNNKQQEQSKLDEEKRKKRDAVEIIPEGVTEMLLPKVHGPFIGEVEDGQTQSGLISNLFVAPIFR